MTQGIYGLGRFGSFWSQFLAGAGTVLTYDRDNRPKLANTTPVTLPTLCQSDMLWLCPPISAMPEVCAQIASLLSPKTVVLDTCSVKLFPVKTMLDTLPAQTPILACHPMFGPDSAQNDLSGLSIVLCPIRVSKQIIDFWHDYLSKLGLKVLCMTPDEHDREVAKTQGLTHFIGRLLAEYGLSQSALATLGFRKLCEVMDQTCHDSWQLFLDLQNFNPYCAAMRTNFTAALAGLNLKAGFIDRRPGG